MILHVVPVFGKMNRQRRNWGNLRDMFPRQYQLREYVQEDGDPVSDCGRELPRLKWVVDWAIGGGGTVNDVVMLTNSDSFLAVDALKFVSHRRLCFSRRVNGRTWPDWGVDSYELKQKDHGFQGVDLVAFPVKWWWDNEDKIPNLFIGTECWDWVMKFAILFGGGYEIGPVIYHENHPPQWKQEMSSSRVWNRACAFQWATDNGFHRVAAMWDNIGTYEQCWKKGVDYYLC